MQSPSTLDEVLTTIWHALYRGAVQKKDPLHTTTIGTVENGIAEMRTVVLRKTVTKARQLYFYTDIRSEKVDQIKINKTLSWLFYHPKKNFQIRATGSTTIQDKNKLTEQIWKNLPSYGRKTYGTIQSPSTPLSQLSDDLPTLWKKEEIELADTEYAYENFAVVVSEIGALEWLLLQRSGHQRARFVFDNDEWDGQWIVP